MPQVTPHLQGRAYWLSLEHRAASAVGVEAGGAEFPGYDPETILGMSRRRFMQLMGGSMALAGVTLSGCRRWPEQNLAPYANNPKDRTPGVTERYATVFELGGVASGLLVSSYDGRPIKIEGNPTHPYSLGAADAFAQASVLELYDPDRSRLPVRRAQSSNGWQTGPASWEEFEKFAREHFVEITKAGGEGLAILCEATSSPTVLDMKARLLNALPKSQWHEYDAVSADNRVMGCKLAFGQVARPVYQLDKARVIALFDADLLGTDPARLKIARDWSAARLSADEGEMCRMYVAESTLTISGAAGDYRLPVKPSEVGLILKAVAVDLGVVSAGKDRPELNGEQEAFVAALVVDLKAHLGAGLIVVGDRQSPYVHALAQQINVAIDAIDKTVVLVGDGSLDRPTHLNSIIKLADSISSGKVKTLLILGGNPAYDAPVDLKFHRLLANDRGEPSAGLMAIHLSLYHNETSSLCQWHVPRAHYLEAWGDARAWDGTASICQPLIMPLYDGKSIAEILAIVNGDTLARGYDLVRRTFAETWPGVDWEKSWRGALHDGLVAGSAWGEVKVKPLRAIGGLQEAARSKDKDGFELVFTPAYSVHDGRFANNGWLQEMPDPLTKVTWDNAALISKQDADRLGVATGDLIQLQLEGSALEIAAYVMPGQPKGVIAVSLGYGRTAAGNVGNTVGFNAYGIRASDRFYMASGVVVTKTGGRYLLAMTQDHHIIDPIGANGREERIGKKGHAGIIIQEASLDEYLDDPHFVSRNEEGGVSLQLYSPPHEFNDPHAWGMAVDMNSCIGCNACVVACQAENNIPIVGKEQVANNREMHWIRIDRYFKADEQADPGLENPDVVYQPMMCVHCENAPCEQVCPVAATVHDSEGLNTMVYNRCIGTRYCSNNCPYKTRRFNYFDFHSTDPRGKAMPWLAMPDAQPKSTIDEIKQMVYNPDVTVRMRGVMEKCSYCVQRIHAVQIDKRNNGEAVADGDVQTACQQTCPTRAIVFGDLNDPNSKVSRLHAGNRAYSVLGELNTRPRTKHLAKIRNPIENTKA